MKILSWMAISGEKANAYKYPLRFLKWWSSLVLNTFTVSAETIPSPNLFHSSQTLLANLNFPTSKRYLILNSLKLCPLLAPLYFKRQTDQNLKPTFLAPNSYVYQLCVLTRLYDFGLVHFCPQATQHSRNGYWSLRERLQMIFRIIS